MAQSFMTAGEAGTFHLSLRTNILTTYTQLLVRNVGMKLLGNSCHDGNMKSMPSHNPNVRDELELSIVMPCLNEVETVGSCVAKASTFLKREGIRGEVIVADNGSTDGSLEVARNAGARIVQVERRGYGAALSAGIRAGRGRFVIMGDTDDT